MPFTITGLIKSQLHPESNKALTRIEVPLSGLIRVKGIMNKEPTVLTHCGAVLSSTCPRAPPGVFQQLGIQSSTGFIGVGKKSSVPSNNSSNTECVGLVASFLEDFALEPGQDTPGSSDCGLVSIVEDIPKGSWL